MRCFALTALITLSPRLGLAADEQPQPETKVTVRAPGPVRSASEVTRGRDVIEAAPHKTASDLMQLVPGVFITQHSGEGKAHQIFFRGFDASHGQDIEISVGGVPVNEVSNIHGQGYADLHFVMPEVVRELRAKPGSYDPRQGDFAVAGSIAMQLGYDEAGLTAKVGAGSFGTQRLLLAYHPEGESAETFAAFEAYRTDGFGPNRAASRGSLVGQMSKPIGGGVSMRVLGTSYAGRFDSPGVLRAADIERGAIDPYATLDPRQGGSSDRSQLLVELSSDSDKGRWSFAPYLILRSLSLRQNFTGFLGDSLRGGASGRNSDNTQQLQDSTTVGMNASYRRTLRLVSAKDAFEFGMSARADRIEQSQRRLSDVNDEPTSTLVDAAVRASDIAGYVDGNVHALRWLTLRGGVRADVLGYSTRDRVSRGTEQPAQERSAQGMFVGKKLTADVLAAPGLHLLASYGEGFRSPQARALSNGEKTPFAQVHSAEIGLRYAEGRRVQASLAAFRTQLSEDLVFDQDVARSERTPGTVRTGVAADVTMRPREWFQMTTSATYTRAVFSGSDSLRQEGDLLPYVPQWVVRSDARVMGKLGALYGRTLRAYAGTGLEALLRRPLPYGEFGCDVFLVDARVGVRAGEIELSIDATNLLGARWYDGQFVYASNFSKTAVPSLIPTSHVTVGAPRALLATLSLYL